MTNRLSNSPKSPRRLQSTSQSSNNNNVNSNSTNVNSNNDNQSVYARSRQDGALGQPVSNSFSNVVQGAPPSVVNGPYGSYPKTDLDREQQAIDGLTGVNPEVGQGLRMSEKYGYHPSQPFVIAHHKMPKETEVKKGFNQGWKLHVGANPDQVGQLAQQVLPHLQGVPHKVVDKVSTYASDPDGKQIGKFITIYPKDMDQLKEISRSLDPILRESGLSLNTKNQGEQYLGSSGLLSTRYGSFNKKKLIDPNRDPVKDDRNVIAPPWKNQELQQIEQFGMNLIAEQPGMAALANRQAGDRRGFRAGDTD